MKEQKQDLLDLSTEITRENVQRIGEVLALIVTGTFRPTPGTICIGSTTVCFGI